MNAICQTAARLFKTEYSFISFLDDDCLWHVGREGFDAPPVPRDKTFCSAALEVPAGDALVVLDATQDARFANFPGVVEPPHVRFYAGISIDLGDPSLDATVCVADPRPRAAFSRNEERRLRDFAVLVRTILTARQHRLDAEQARADSREAERRFKLIADHTNDIIVIGDLDLVRTYVSPAVLTVLGYEPAEFMSQPIAAFIHPDDAHLITDPVALTSRTGGQLAQIETLRYRHKAGHYVWMEVSARSAFHPVSKDLIGYVATLRDVTQRRQAEEQARHMALHDLLTGLPNRALFRDRLEQAIVAAAYGRKGPTVMVCNLDRFKVVNDSLGHAAGDKLLRIVARRMASVLRPHDTLSRVGGDEFAIILSGNDAARPWSGFAERLIQTVSSPVQLEQRSVEVGLSIGAAVGGGSDAAEELFKRADIALHEAKASGYNTFREFHDEAGARVTKRGQLALDMRDAIRRQEFHLHYQPIAEVDTGRVVSLEALLRWNHPSDGEILPATFIPIAEEAGLIVELGSWVLRQACWEALSWPTHVNVAVNVSALQLRGDAFHGLVSRILAATGLPASRLSLEITESALMQDTDDVIGCLRSLRRLGVSIALDEFGTGSSSLGYLRRFAFTTIKLDRSFVRDIANADAAAIVRAVVGIGERLGMEIVAEGVDTDAQLSLVRREGCRYVQGFHYNRPLSGADAGTYLQQTTQQPAA